MQVFYFLIIHVMKLGFQHKGIGTTAVSSLVRLYFDVSLSLYMTIRMWSFFFFFHHKGKEVWTVVWLVRCLEWPGQPLKSISEAQWSV